MSDHLPSIGYDPRGLTLSELMWALSNMIAIGDVDLNSPVKMALVTDEGITFPDISSLAVGKGTAIVPEPTVLIIHASSRQALNSWSLNPLILPEDKAGDN